MAIQIQLRRGTSTQWADANTILAEAEIAVELDTFQFKVGDGVTHWSDLPYGGIHGPIAGSDTQVIFNYSGYANASPAFTFDYSTNTLNLSNNLIVTNTISTANLIVTDAFISNTLTVDNSLNVYVLSVNTDLTVGNTLNVYGNLVAISNIEVYDTINVNNSINVFNTLTTNNSIVQSTLDVYDTLNVNNTISVSNTVNVTNNITLGNNFILGANLNNGEFNNIGPAIVLGTDSSILTNGPDNIPWYAPQGGSFATEQHLFFANASLIQVGNSSSYFNLYNDGLYFLNENDEKAGILSVSTLEVDSISTTTLTVDGISSGSVGSDNISANSIWATLSVSVGDETTNVSINSTSFSGTSNNTLYVGDLYYDNVVSNSQLTANLANYSNTYLMLANDDTTYSNAVYYTDTVIDLVNTAIVSNAAIAYSNSVLYTDTVIGLVNTAIIANAATTYANSVLYTDTKIELVNTAIVANAVTTYSNSVLYTDTVIDLVNTAIVSNASITYSNSVLYTDTVIGLVNTAIVTNATTTYANSVLYTDTVIDLVNTAIVANAATTYANATTFASNATNISSGTISEPHLPYRMNQDVLTTDNVTFNTITSTDNVSIGTGKSLIINANTSIDFNTSTYKPTFQKGRMYWDNEEQTIIVYGDGSSFEQSMGQREWVRCRNSTASTIAKGTPVYITGVHIPGNPVHGHHPTIAPGDATDFNTSQIIGITGEEILSGAHGYVVVRGYIEGIDTSALTSGQRAHLGFQTPGTIILNAPEYPNFPTDLGMCLTSDATNGTFYVDLAMHTAERFRTTQDMYVGGDLTVAGNVNVTGNVFSTTATNLSVSDNFIYIGAGDNISTAETTFTGSGLNDMTFRGVYEGSTSQTYYVKITATSPDKFSWSKDNFTTTVAANVSITTNRYSLDNGISIEFNANTGHTLNDTWSGTASPVNVDLGWVGNYNDGTYYHSGLFRDASDGVYKFFQHYIPEPDADVNIDTGHASFQYASVQANVFVGNLLGTADNSSKLGNIDAASYQLTSTLAANVATLTSNNSSYVFGKIEANLNVNNALTANSATYANNSTYAFGKTEIALNVNNALTANSATYANNSSYVFGKTEIALNVNNALTANSATYANNSSYVFGKTEIALNVNNAVTANNSTYAFDKTESNLNVNNALTANSATYANNSSYVFGKTESNLNVNNAITANNSSYLNNKPEANLNVNSAITANNSSYLGGVAAALYVNTSGSYTITGVHTYNANIVLGSGVSANGSYGTAGQALTTNGTSVYWSTIVGTNTAASYVWTNTHTFNSNVTLATTAALIANGLPGTAGQVLTSNGTTVYWSTASGGGFSNGQSISVNNFVVTGYFSANGSNGTSGQILTSNGSAVYWSNASINVTTSNATTQSFTGNGTNTVFTLSQSIADQNNVIITLDGLIQIPNTHYSISNTTLTFTDAPIGNTVIEARTLTGGISGGSGGGGATGGGTDKAFYENDTTITTDYTLTINKNAMTAGPITINTGITVTIPSGSTWTIV